MGRSPVRMPLKMMLCTARACAIVWSTKPRGNWEEIAQMKQTQVTGPTCKQGHKSTSNRKKGQKEEKHTVYTGNEDKGIN